MFMFLKTTVSLLTGVVNSILWMYGALGVHLLIINFLNQRDAIAGMNKTGNVFLFSSKINSVVSVRGEISDYLLVGIIFGIVLFIAGLRSSNYAEMFRRLLYGLGGSCMLCGGVDLAFTKIFVHGNISPLAKILLPAGVFMVLISGLLSSLHGKAGNNKIAEQINSGDSWTPTA